MSRPGPTGEPSPRLRATLPVLVALTLLLPLFPPETRGESMAGCALLILLLAALAGVGRRGGAGLVAAAASAWALSLVAVAPGAVPAPVALGLLAAAGGLAAARLPTRVRLHPALPHALAVAGGLAALHGLIQFGGGLEAAAARVAEQAALPDRAAVLERLREGRAFAGFATPAALGGFLALALPVTVALAVERGGRARAVLVALALVQGAGLVAAGSATALAALAGALALAAITRAGIPRRRLAAALLAVALAIVAVVALRGARLIDPDDPGSPWRLRAGNLRIAWQVFADRPWLGAGPGGYAELYPAYRTPGDNEARHAHDLPLELLAEAGVPGLLLLGGLFFAAFLGPLLRRRAAPTARWVTGVHVGLAAFAIQNLADFTAYFASLLWLAALLRGATGGGTEADLPRRARPLPLLPVAGLAVVAAAALVAAAGGLAWNARVAARYAAAAGDPGEALRLAGRATRLAPWEADGWLLRAGARLDAAGKGGLAREHVDEALEAAERAVRVSPVRPAARALRGRLREALGDVPGAFADFRAAASGYPMDTNYAEQRARLAARLAAAPPPAGEPGP